LRFAMVTVPVAMSDGYAVDGCGFVGRECLVEGTQRGTIALRARAREKDGTSFCITAPRADAKAGRVGDTPALWVLQKLEAAKLEVRSCPSKHDAGALRPVAALMRGRGRAEGLDRPPGRWR
jgi:hypothetical protein